jgi:hypothetical protein
MKCKKCESEYVVNKWFGLCQECNNERLHGNKFGKVAKYNETKKEPLKKDNNKNKRIVDRGQRLVVWSGGRSAGKKILRDEIFYEACFNECKVHKCEECGSGLNEIFRGDDGKVINRARYSHIVPKSIAPELRHQIININHLCLTCHQKWDFGKRTEMKIYAKNQVRLPRYLKPLDTNI